MTEKKTEKKKRGKKRLSKALVIEALQKANGVKALAARMLKVKRQSIDHWIKNYEEVAEAYDEVNETTIDEIEGMLINNCKTEGKHQQRAIEYYLTSKARHRGYGAREKQADTEKTVIIQHTIPGFTDD